MNLSTRIEVSKPVKIGIILGVLIIIYIFYTREPPPVVILDTNLPDQVPNPAVMTSPPTTSPPPPPDPKLVVDVYYECLCPDSRYFVLHHLLPTVEKVGSLMDVRLWPYGKASTHKTDTGYSFNCQHGEVECEGNMYHACVTVMNLDQEKMVAMVACMIQDNMEPKTAASNCATQHGIYFERLDHCATGAEGTKLHYKAGVKTDALQPPVSFIPTIEIDGSQHKQGTILKDFIGEVCRIYTEKHLTPGQKIANCP